MQDDSLDHLLSTLQVRLSSFVICEIGSDWRLKFDPRNCPVCYFVMRGRGFLESDGRCIQAAEGTILIVPSGTAMSISGPDEASREISASESCDAEGHWLRTLRARSHHAALVLGCASIAATCGGNDELFRFLDAKSMAASVADNESLAVGFAALLSEMTEGRVGGKVIAECLMKHALILLLREQAPSPDSSAMLDGVGDKRVIRAAAAMIERPEEAHSLSSLADLSGMSRSSFMDHFMREYGKSPGEFLRSVRMHSAAVLLGSSAMPIKRLAAAVGYASRSQFSHAFKQAFGVGPSAYRARQLPSGEPDFESLESSSEYSFAFEAGASRESADPAGDF